VKKKVMYRKRKRQKNLQKLGDVLRKTLKNLNISRNFGDQNISNAWNKAVGPQISAQTHPDRLRKNTLFVKVSNSIWMHQLQFMKLEIIDKTNKILGKEMIKDVYFSLGVIPKNEENFIFTEHNTLNERDSKMIRESAASVSDKELSNILKRVMTKEIIRRRMREKQKSP
jgi:hypothetical protein